MKKLFLFLSIISFPLYAQTFFNVEDYDFNSRMEFFNVPGVSITVVSDRGINWSAGFGEGIDEETLFQASSISNILTAFAVFQLIEKGQLDLDIDINDYLTSWALEKTIVTRNRPVTLRMLLSHTSGIHESGLRGYAINEKYESIYKSLPQPRYYPGIKRRYSWSGYTIIQKIIEDITGRSFKEYMEDEVLIPLGMNRSSYRVIKPGELENVATGHDLFGDEIEGGWKIYPQLAAAGLWSTPTDIARYIIEIEKILSEGYTGLISRESVVSMLSYQPGGWGLGPSLKFTDEELVFRLSGENSGYKSYFIAKPYSGDAVVVMCSGDNSWKLIMEVIHSFESYKSWGI